MICGAVFLLTGFVIFISSSMENNQPVTNPKSEEVGALPLSGSVLSKNEKDSIRKISPPEKQNKVPLNIAKEKKPDHIGIEPQTEKIEQDKKKAMILKNLLFRNLIKAISKSRNGLEINMLMGFTLKQHKIPTSCSNLN